MDASDDRLIKLGELAKTIGIDISLEEAKAYLAKSHDYESEMSPDELQAVAGGKKIVILTEVFTMDKFKGFYAQAMTDDAVKAEIKKILGKTPVNDATDEQLIQLSELAKTIGLDISLKEAKAYLGNADDDEEGELSDDELQAVAGGEGKGDCDPHRAPHLNKHILNQ